MRYVHRGAGLLVYSVRRELNMRMAIEPTALIPLAIVIAGALANGLILWARSGEPFTFRKYVETVGAAIMAALLLLVTDPLRFQILDMNLVILLFLSGMGWDGAIHALRSYVAQKAKGS